MSNVAVMVEDQGDTDNLLGLYQGVPLTKTRDLRRCISGPHHHLPRSHLRPMPNRRTSRGRGTADGNPRGWSSLRNKRWTVARAWLVEAAGRSLSHPPPVLQSICGVREFANEQLVPANGRPVCNCPKRRGRGAGRRGREGPARARETASTRELGRTGLRGRLTGADRRTCSG